MKERTNERKDEGKNKRKNKLTKLRANENKWKKRKKN